MSSDRLGKVGMALAAFVGVIVFAWLMVGMLTLLGYLAVIGAFVGIAVLIIGLVIRFLQMKVRVLTFYGFFGVIAAVWSISLIPRTEVPWAVLVAVLLGVIAGLGLRSTYLARFRELTQPESPRGEYIDDSGVKHFFVVYGYQQQTRETAEKAYKITILVMAVIVLVVYVGILLGVDRMIDTTTWGASLLAFAAAVALIAFFLSALKVEQESGVEIFTQSLPGETECGAGCKFATILPKPVSWVAEFCRDLWEACRKLYMVSVRR